METKQLVFSRNAFVNLVQSCTEAYPYEALGDLFGYEAVSPREMHYDVNSAVCFQIVEERSEEHVVEYAVSHYRSARYIDSITGELLLGGYHSHPDSSPELSRADIRFLRNRPRFQIEVVVSLVKLSNTIPWRYIIDEKPEEQSIIGSVIIEDTPYAVHVVGYHISSRQIRPLLLFSTYVEMIEYLNNALDQPIDTLGDIMERTRAREKDQRKVRGLLHDLEFEIYRHDRITYIRKICKQINKLFL